MEAGQLLINGHFRFKRVTGVERYAWEIISAFDKNNVPYGWIQPPRGLKSDALRQLWVQAVMPVKLPENSILWSPTNTGPILCSRQVITLHDIAAQLHPEWFDEKYVWWRRLILPPLLKRVKSIITVSEFSRQAISEHFPQAQGKINVIYNGVRTDHFYRRDEDEINQLRKELDLQKPYILSVGSLDPRKNIGRLIKAWNLLPEKTRKEMVLVIAGESARKFAFKLNVDYDESVKFIGYIKDKKLPVLYSGAEIFMYPSLFEGFGLPVLEAMACGTAVITSNTTALQEIAGPAKVVNPESIDEIRDEMLNLINNSSITSTMIEKGYEWVKRFTWQDSAKQTIKLLRNSLN